jgi:virulence-associated protein VapD
MISKITKTQTHIRNSHVAKLSFKNITGTVFFVSENIQTLAENFKQREQMHYPIASWAVNANKISIDVT